MSEPCIALESLTTEQRNPESMEIDQLDTAAMLELINREDHKVASAVGDVLPAIARAVDLIAVHLKRGGRLVYIGAGTSGRLGVLDASECPPTFGVDPAMVCAIIAGGQAAMTSAVERAEDDADAARSDLEEIGFCQRDVLVGIAASGRTPYVLGAMKWAARIGAPVIGVSCADESRIAECADISITPVVGPEVITGSTRLKAGTAQKLVLNMLSTAVMVKLGKVFSNLMVDVVATNAKLSERQIQIVSAATGCAREHAIHALEESNGHCKTAIVMLAANAAHDDARGALDRADGHAREALASFQKGDA